MLPHTCLIPYVSCVRAQEQHVGIYVSAMQTHPHLTMVMRRRASDQIAISVVQRSALRLAVSSTLSMVNELLQINV